MGKFQVNYTWYKRIYFIMQIIVPSFIILFLAAFFVIIYESIQSKDHSEIGYALFAANAISCNCLLAFGRSPIFMNRFEEREQRLIYNAAAMFLYSTIISLFVSAYIYANTDKGFGKNEIVGTVTGQWIINISVAVGLGISILFSIAGVIFFFRWAKKASDKTGDEMEKEHN